MANPIMEDIMVVELRNTGGSRNAFYRLYLGRTHLMTQNGRIGARGQFRSYEFPTHQLAANTFASKRREKFRGGYDYIPSLEAQFEVESRLWDRADVGLALHLRYLSARRPQNTEPPITTQALAAVVEDEETRKKRLDTMATKQRQILLAQIDEIMSDL
jgi:predicted DNA-binding WGR domain protein